MVLSFDSGTTNTKAFLYNNKAELIASSSHPTNIYYRGAGRVEQEAENWWEALCRATERLYKIYQWDKKDIEAIGISSQGGTFVPLKKDLSPLMPAVTWLDNRGESAAKTMSEGKKSDYFYNKTGHDLKGWSPPAVWKWIQVEEPSVPKNLGRISFVADYLNYKLTGSFFIDPTSAQMSCFYNIVLNTWDKDILEMSGISGEHMPVVLKSNSCGGCTNRISSAHLNILQGTPVVAGGHDQYCACLGAGAHHKSDCLLSCGTAWVLLITTDELFFMPDKELTPGRHLIDNHFGLMASIGNAGIILEWMRNNIKVQQVEQEPKSDVVVIPEFSRGKGEIKNISLSTKGSEIYYATKESLVLKIKQRLDEVENKSPVNRLVMVGGAVKEQFLVGMMEKITEKQIVLPDLKEASGRGAALLALNIGK